MPFAGILRAAAVLSPAPLLVGLSLTVARAQEHVVDDWYVALAAADAPGLAALLSPDATIRLTDLGVEQSKAEFLRSLDEWGQAAEGATIRHRIERTDGAVTTVIACYDFPSNDVLMRETFRIAGRLIAENEQARITESCDAY